MPGAPGRVVTLVPSDGSRCLGVAYRVAPERVDAVWAQLDHREQGGYARRAVELALEDGGRLSAWTYLATPENPDYLGPAPSEAIASQVLSSRGPSGANAEYVLELAAFVESAGVDEPHLLEVAARVRAARGRRGAA